MFRNCRFLTNLALCLPLLCTDAVASKTPSVEQMLAASDTIRNPSVPFSVKIKVTEYRNKKLEDEGNILVHAKLSARYGQYDSLVRILEPRRDRGKLMLKTVNGNEVWFYDPAVQSGMRISPQQRLLGQAANGDVVSVNLAHDYSAVLEGEETVADGEKIDRASWRLRLRSSSPNVTYAGITYWLERGTHRPIKAQMYSDSGRLLKTAYYRRFEEQLGQMRPTEVVILDGVDTQLVTVLRYSDYRASEVPGSWYTREGLTLIRE